jgi:hypothetical protein
LVFPDVDDQDIGVKYTWLVKRMKRWYVGELIVRFGGLFDSGDLKASQSFNNWMALATTMDADFEKAKEDAATAALFTTVDSMMAGSMIITPGNKTDRIGQDLTNYVTR